MAVCKLCGKPTESLYHVTEQLVLDMIRRDHPDWVEADGSCRRCVEYYEGLDDALKVEDDALGK